MKRVLSKYRWSLIGVMAVVLMVVGAACGGEDPTATPAPTNTPVPTNTPEAMEPTEEPTAMMEEPTPTAMMEEETPTAMPEKDDDAMMMEGKPGGVIPMQSLCGPNFQMIHLASFCGQIHASPIYNNIVELNPENARSHRHTGRPCCRLVHIGRLTYLHVQPEPQRNLA